MAILVLSSRQYANLLDKAVGANHSLKVRRAIEKLRAKKRTQRKIQINLEQVDAMEITGIIYSEDFIQREATTEQLAAQLDAFALDHPVPDLPYITYSISEWKAIVETATKENSTLVLTDPNVQNVFYGLSKLYGAVEYHLQKMVRTAHGLSNDEHEVIHRDPAQDGATAFGAVSEVLELEED